MLLRERTPCIDTGMKGRLTRRTAHTRTQEKGKTTDDLFVYLLPFSLGRLSGKEKQMPRERGKRRTEEDTKISRDRTQERATIPKTIKLERCLATTPVLPSLDTLCMYGDHVNICVCYICTCVSIYLRRETCMSAPS